MRLGILGGVFNPPHLGHVICAQEAHAELGLDEVIFLPVGQAAHRSIPGDPGPEVRARLCEYAVEGDERFSVSRAEVDRPGPSYTVDTLRLLADERPDDELFLILGADQAASLPSWREPEPVLALARVAVAERGGLDRRAVMDALHGLAGGERVTSFEMPRVDISSSEVRERVASGRPIRYLVPHKVVDYVEANGLYREPTAVSAG